MIKVDGYKSYNGGKSGSGTYQTLINRIPPHITFISTFLGNCGVARHIKPAASTYLNDIDDLVIAEWLKAALPGTFQLWNKSAVEALEWVKCMDNDKTFVFHDPPYLKDTRKSQADLYRYEMTHLEHEVFLAAALKLNNAMQMICHYPNPLYDELLKGWNTFDYYSRTRNGMAHERIYYNYELGDQLHDYGYLGENFRQRERITRIKNNFLLKLDRLDAKERNKILSDLASHIK